VSSIAGDFDRAGWRLDGAAHAASPRNLLGRRRSRRFAAGRREVRQIYADRRCCHQAIRGSAPKQPTRRRRMRHGYADRVHRTVHPASRRSNWPRNSRAVRSRYVPLRPQCRDDVVGETVLDPDFVGQPLMVQPRCRHRRGDIHMVIEHVDDHLQHRRNDAAAAGRTRHQHRLAVLQHDGWRHRRQGPLAGAGQVGLESDQTEGVGGAGRRGEIVELVVEQHAGAVATRPTP